MQGARGGVLFTRGCGTGRQTSLAVLQGIGGTAVAKDDIPVSHFRIQVSRGRSPWKFPTIYDELLQCCCPAGAQRRGQQFW